MLRSKPAKLVVPRMSNLSHCSPKPSGAETKSKDSRKAKETKNRDKGAFQSRTEKQTWLYNGTGRVFLSLLANELRSPGEAQAAVSSRPGFELLCTYNWTAAKEPCIYVPGAPAQLSLRDLPFNLPRDKGHFLVDQNSLKATKYPFEPLFQALSIIKPHFDFNHVDLVTNRNSLRKLFNFAAGKHNDSFRIDLNVVHNTLFLTRRERNLRQYLSGNKDSGFGHNFEREISKVEPGLEDSTSHHRVIRYQMGSLNCVVRFEVDICCPYTERDHQKGRLESTEFTDVTSSLEKLTIGDDSKDARIRVIQRGHHTPSSAAAEVKTSSGRDKLAFALPQLWFGRTRHFICGYHKDGQFTRIKNGNVEKRLEHWEEQQQDHLRTMVRLITRLREITADSGGRCIAVYNKKDKPARLVIFASLQNHEPLPTDIIQRYWQSNQEAAALGSL